MHDDPLLQAARSLRPAYEAVDWAATSLGPMASWSPTLRTAVDLLLSTRFPITLFWGPELVLVYNEAYVELIPGKHPAALGARTEDIFPEAWELIGPLIHGIMAGDHASWMQDAFIPLVRNGELVEAHFTFSYSPVHDEHGAIVGVMDISTETTRQVQDRRRLALLSELRERLGGLQEAAELPALALPVLRAAEADLPAVDLRLDPGHSHSDDPTLAALEPPSLEGVEPVVVADGETHVAWLPLGERRDGEAPPALVVRLSPLLASDEAYQGFLTLVAGALGQALDRAVARQAERLLAADERRLSETLQRSLLTEPAQPEHLEIAVRYQPAAERAQIGGDWYDAFVLPDGTLSLVIGDVAGHDRRAAATMAHTRNVLRGVAYTLGEGPAAVLTGLDTALIDMSVDTCTTAVLAQVEADRPGGGRMLRWSNAGHPPPVLLLPDGTTQLLARPADPLLGLAAPTRADHAVELPCGASVIFYTDGLIERRGAAIDTGVDWLRSVLTGREALSAEALCDHLVGQLEDVLEDDLALLVLRVLT